MKSTAIITTGATPATNVPDYYGGNIPFVKPPDLGESKYIGKTAENLTRHGAEKSRIVPPKSICVCCIGSLGKSSIATDYICTNQQINSITTSLNEQFVYYLCNSSYFIAALHSMATAITIALVNKSKMEQILIPFPPLAEQQRIVEQIETLLGYVDIIDTDAETLEKSITLAKQKILDLAIRGKLVPQDPSDEPASELLKKIKAEKDALVKAGKLKKDKHESYIFKSDDNCYHENIDGEVTDITEKIPFNLPEGWAWARLYSITSFLHRGKSPKYTDEKKYPMFAQKCNQKDGIHMEKALFCLPEQYEKFPSEYKLQNCDIVINSTGTGTLGRVGIFYKRFLNNYESTVPDSHVTLVRAFENYILGEYLYACFKSPSYQQMMLDNADGSTNQKELYTKVLELFFIPLPPLAEQKRIVSQVEKLFSVLETMRG